MNKSVLISIQPKWCALIANDKKTIEVRKTAPKLQTPFKCYIYCTKQGRPLVYGQYNPCAPECYQQTYGYSKEDADKIFGNLQGKVIGEFMCDKIYEIKNLSSRFMVNNDIALTDSLAKESCLQFEDMCNYLGEKDGYAWHISDLVIYDTPKELGEFNGLKKCNQCKVSGYESSACIHDENCIISLPLTRPPQSWCYIEELKA